MRNGLLGVGSPCFEGVVNRVCPPELQLSRAGASGAGAPFLDLRLSISSGFVSSEVCGRRGDFDFDTVNFPFLDGDVPRSTSYGVCVSRLVRFARVSGRVVDFSARGESLAARLLQRSYRYHKLRKTFSKFCRRHYGLVSEFSVGLRALLHRGLSGPEFYGDLVCELKKIVGGAGFSDRFGRIIVRYKRIGCGMDIVRQSACLVFGPVTVGGFASLFGCAPVGRASGWWWPRRGAICFGWFGPGLFCLLLGPPGFGCWFSFAPVFRWCCSAPRGSPGVGRGAFLSSPHLCFVVVFVCDLFVSRDDPLVNWGGGGSAWTERLCVLGRDGGWGRGWVPVVPVWAPPVFFYTDRSKAVLLLWFLTVLAVCIYTLVQLLC